MKSFKSIAAETETTTDDVKTAMDAAEQYECFIGKDANGCPVSHTEWFVACGSNGAYGHQEDRRSHADGFGSTKQEAVVAALNNIASWR